MTTIFKITERDIHILHFVNQFGFCEPPHLIKKFPSTKRRLYKIMARLMEGGLVRHERIFYNRPGIYRLTKKGAGYTDLPAIKTIPLSYYHHEITLIDLCLTLKARYPTATLITERQLKHEKFMGGLGVKGHVADGLLLFEDGKKIAIELELSLKGQLRVEKIFRAYSTQFDIEEVWYFCTREVKTALTDLVVKKPFIKLFLAEEWLNG